MYIYRHAGLCWGFAALLCLPAVASAQGRSDILEQQKLLLKVAADKMEMQTTDALAEARKLAASEPAQAVAVLKKVLAQLESDNALSDARKASLIRTVKDRITATQTAAAPAKQPVKGSEPTADTADSEQRIINRTLELVAKMQREGRAEEANRLVSDLARRYPDNLAVQTAVRTSATTVQLKTGSETINDTDKRFVGTLTSVDKSAVPPNGDLELPKDWAKKMADRKNVNEQVLTAKELAILKALNTTIKPDYPNAGLMDVLDDLSQKLNITFAVDKVSLAEANVTSDTQVNLVLPRGITARTALRKILADVGLTYVIKNETVQVMTEAKAKELMTTRVYYIGNLMTGGPYADAGIRFNPWFDQLQVQQNVKSLIDMIQGSVDPQTWQANGGSGTIRFYAPTMSLIIRQSAEVHGMMGGGSALSK